MKRCIDPEKIRLTSDLKDEDGGSLIALSDIRRAIAQTPSEDVQEVRHGKWILHKPRRTGRNATYKCSCCGKLRSSCYNDVQEWEYCPCGAKMDKIHDNPKLLKETRR